ncbi:MAG: cytochrome c oxidase subunit 3 [Nitratireductor sp.]|nr:cytochrome c oxidase subunit 3 [Nitratireductor sp.]MCC0020361.1 cytochrome c oxidase subunit 3 [Nitratireductor sp.]
MTTTSSYPDRGSRGSGWTAVEKEELERAVRERQAGFWLYLLSDALIFALLFATWAVMADRIATGPDTRSLLDLNKAFVETMLLLSSSFTFGLATLELRADRVRNCLLWMAVTFLLGAAFLGFELTEFMGLIDQGAGPDVSGSLSSFFTLVGTHGLHVTAGLVWLAVSFIQLLVIGNDIQLCARIERLGMFWHFLDIVWIGIFTFVYLWGAAA